MSLSSMQAAEPQTHQLSTAAHGEFTEHGNDVLVGGGDSQAQLIGYHAFRCLGQQPDHATQALLQMPGGMAAVPALSPWGALLLSALSGLLGLAMLRRRV